MIKLVQLIQSLRLKRAIRKANRLHKKTGHRYRVFYIMKRFRVWTRNDIRSRKKSGLLKYWLKAGEDFDRFAMYDTGSNYIGKSKIINK